MKTHDLGSTTQYDSPTWNGHGFAEREAQVLWIRLPQLLKDIAISEMNSGNNVESILENRERDIVLLSLTRGPLSNPEIVEQIKVHKTHYSGNYCYDGTSETFEHIESGCLLAFEDPEFEA